MSIELSFNQICRQHNDDNDINEECNADDDLYEYFACLFVCHKILISSLADNDNDHSQNDDDDDLEDETGGHTDDDKSQDNFKDDPVWLLTHSFSNLFFNPCFF